MGRINGASAGTTIVDLGGAGVIANANIGLWQRGFTMVNSNGTYVNCSAQSVGGGECRWHGQHLERVPRRWLRQRFRL